MANEQEAPHIVYMVVSAVVDVDDETARRDLAEKLGADYTVMIGTP